MNRREIIIGALFSVSSCVPSEPSIAINYQKDEDENINKWYSDVYTNGNFSCCGLGDAYWADIVEFPSDVNYFFATITDDRKIDGRPDLNGARILVPYDTVDRRRQGNPTGHNIIFMKPGGSSSELQDDSLVKNVADKNYYDNHDVSIYCFFPNQGN